MNYPRTKFYSLYDVKEGRYLSLGRNSKSLKILKDELLNYMKFQGESELKIKKAKRFRPGFIACLYKLRIDTHIEKL